MECWSVWSVAEDYPDDVAATVDDLGPLVEHDDDTVQHNAVEALGALVRERPDTVVPTPDTLRELLTHDDVAMQHNAAGVLGHLAKTHPDTVIPAIGGLRNLCTHEDEAVLVGGWPPTGESSRTRWTTREILSIIVLAIV